MTHKQTLLPLWLKHRFQHRSLQSLGQCDPLTDPAACRPEPPLVNLCCWVHMLPAKCLLPGLSVPVLGPSCCQSRSAQSCPESRALTAASLLSGPRCCCLSVFWNLPLRLMPGSPHVEAHAQRAGEARPRWRSSSWSPGIQRPP